MFYDNFASPSVLELEKHTLQTAIEGNEIVAQREKYGKLIDLNGNEFAVPNYTIKQIYDAIPRHCFERNVFRSLLYVFQDLLGLFITFYIFHTYCTNTYIPSYPIRFTLWSLYTFIQGLFGSGLWVLAHECGHMAFSSWKIFNDTLGLILHSALLVPYFSWKITHRNHHKHIANMSTDTSFVPATRLAYAQRFGKTVESIAEYAEDTPVYTFFYLLFHQLVDWQVYMVIMIGVGEFADRLKWFEKQAKMKGELNPARNKDGTLIRKYPLLGSHYNPRSPLYTPRDAKFILITDIALLVMLSVLYFLGQRYGWLNLLVWYGIPYLWVNHWLIALTYLHHSDPSLPHYNPSTWTFTRGAASTIDRDFGFIGRHIFHNIIETHVLHHHISIIPHYHAEEASEAIKKVMGIHYREDHSGKGMWNFMRNYWMSATSCSWVEPSEGAAGEGKDILFFRNRIGRGVKPAEMKAKVECEK
ncbi:oleate delta-12 desaturase [Acephala macrosclerotiorum]|nr:oleate delta-12 desaturase [Acephala macrosclerotiorum]